MRWRPSLAPGWWKFWTWRQTDDLTHSEVRRTGPIEWRRRLSKAQKRALLRRAK